MKFFLRSRFLLSTIPRKEVYDAQNPYHKTHLQESRERPRETEQQKRTVEQRAFFLEARAAKGVDKKTVRPDQPILVALAPGFSSSLAQTRVGIRSRIMTSGETTVPTNPRRKTGP